MIKKILLFSLAFLFLHLSPVMAVNGNGATQTNRATNTIRKTARLTEARLKTCLAKENSIQKQTQQLTRLSTNMLNVFDKIATRVETYYTSVVLPAGKSLSNYDQLVADVAAKKTATQTALAKAQASSGTFVCDGDDPVATITEFRSGMVSVKAALKEYRTSVNKLIVAVRTISIPKPTETEK